MKRKPNWRNDLTGFMIEKQSNPPPETEIFCAYFVADAVKVMTGVDLMKGMRGLKDLKALKAKVKAKGLKSHLDIPASQLEEIPVGLAVPGDVAMLRNEAFGIVQGEYVYTISGQGVALVAIDAATRAFRVPSEE